MHCIRPGVCALLATLILAFSPPLLAITPLFDDGYGVGGIGGWVSGGVNEGFGQVVTEGECFSNNDTSGIVFTGNRAAMVRSGRSGSPSSIGTLTSPVFTAGIGIGFRALTETMRGKKFRGMPVDFSVNVLNTQGQRMKSVRIRTATVELYPGCPGTTTNGAFSSHFVDTREFAGQSIRIQFAQNTRIEGTGLFTLVDEIIRFDLGNTQVLPHRPVAAAGISENAEGRLRLDGSLSRDPENLLLEYRWRVRGDVFEREGQFPCIDDLNPGNHQVTLVVSNGLYTDSDTLHFVIQEIPEADDEETEATETDEEEEEEDSESTKDGGFTLDCSDGLTTDEMPMDENTDPDENSDSDSESMESSMRDSAPPIEVSAVAWEAISDVDGNLVILTPTDSGTPGARLFDPNGILLEEGNYDGQTADHRGIYRFSQPGAVYLAPLYLQVGNDTYRVDDPGFNYN